MCICCICICICIHVYLFDHKTIILQTMCIAYIYIYIYPPTPLGRRPEVRLASASVPLCATLLNPANAADPKPLRRQFLLRRQLHYAQPYSTPPMPPTPKPLRRRFHYAQPYSTPPMPPTPKPKGRRRQRDPQCRSAQEEVQPLNDPKQAHLVAYPASENISQIDSLELSSRLLSSEVACARVHCSSGQVELSLFKWPSHVAEPLFPTRP